MLKAALKRAVVAEEGRRRAAITLPDLAALLTAALLADGHVKQEGFIGDLSRLILALCSRRAGKTSGVARRKLRRAVRSESRQVYITLTKDQARNTMWEPIWKPLLRRRGVPAKHDETRLISTFRNGSVVRFTGSDDVRHIETELGSALDEATLDECQSASDSVLVPLVKRILPPALADRGGTLVLTGTVPEVEAGLFWDLWLKSNGSRHNWSMFDNPFMPNARAELAEYLRANPGLTEDSPLIQREWFGRFKFDKTATAYTYDQGLNSYAPNPPRWLDGTVFPAGRVLAADPWPGIEVLSVGIDPGAMDRMAVEVVGWGSGTPNVQHIFEWVAPKGANLSWNRLGEVLGVIAAQYNAAHWHYDAGSSTNELDTFTRVFGVPVVKAANKADKIGQVRLVNGLLTSARLKVIAGSGLEEDMQKARWDQDARARGQWNWASAWHPDPADAARYALKPYFDSYQPPDPVPLREKMRQEYMEVHRAVDEEPREPSAADGIADMLGIERDW